MKSILVGLFCLAGLAAGQATEPLANPAPRQWIQRVIDVKYADPNAIARLLGSLQSNIGLPDRVVAQPELHAISIGTLDPSFVKLAEDIVQRFDVPGAKPATAPQLRGIEIVAHILLAGPKASSGDAVPADLEPVVKQLKSTFGYTDIRLLDSALIRGRETKGSEVSGTLSGLLEGMKTPTTYRMRFRDVSVEQTGKVNSVRLGTFNFSTRIPFEAGMGQYQFMDLGFDTDLNVLEGQKVVVGKSHLGPGNEALILVVSARVVD